MDRQLSDTDSDEEYFSYLPSNLTSKRQRISSFQEEESAILSSFVTDESLSVTFMELDLLDCTICYRPLTIPVYQCENGHTACSSCRTEFAHKCHSCTFSVGNIRSRAIERILETVKIPCQNMKYGCRETISYSKKCECDHDKTCIYVPCSCPILGCNFISSSEKLRRHVRRHRHVGTKNDIDVRGFFYDEKFTLSLNHDENTVVLQEKDEDVLFIASHSQEITGNKITISCLGPLSTEGYWYELSTDSTGGSNFSFQSYTKNVQNIADKPSSVGLLLPSSQSFVPNDKIHVDVIIWRKDE